MTASNVASAASTARASPVRKSSRSSTPSSRASRCAAVTRWGLRSMPSTVPEKSARRAMARAARPAPQPMSSTLTVRRWTNARRGRVRRRQSTEGAGVGVRIFPGGVAGLFPRPDFGPEGLCDASLPPDDVRVEKGGCGSDVDGGGSASVSGADVGGRGVGLTVFTGSVESGWCASSLDLGAGKVVSFAGGAPITELSTSTNPRMASTGSATTRPFRRLNGPKKGRPRTLR